MSSNKGSYVLGTWPLFCSPLACVAWLRNVYKMCVRPFALPSQGQVIYENLRRNRNQKSDDVRFVAYVRM